jgi:ATP-dependent DNA helicase RecQ
MLTLDHAREKLQESFGFSTFREGQVEVIERLLQGKSVLAIFPTGAGKSLCYQLPAILFNGVTIVVSPLIALMKDQVEFLRSHQIAAGRFDSSLTQEEYRTTLNDLTQGRLKLLFLSPEKFGSETFQNTLKRLKISLLAIDESHCISEWGHNFRPDYLKLGRLVKDHTIERVLCLTATAPPMVAKQIADTFAISSDDVVLTDFHRKNLTIRFTPTSLETRHQQLIHRLQQQASAATIIYVTLRRTADEFAAMLNRSGLVAKGYHAGMESEERHEVQDWFMQTHGAIIVATIAFGMGIDKRDIRAIYHFNLPKSLESYAQEIGRAGRDRLPSQCEVFACANDRTVLENFVYADTPDPEKVALFIQRILDEPGDFDLGMVQESNQFDIKSIVLETILTYIELAGWIRSRGTIYTVFKVQWLKPAKEVFERFNADRARFLQSIFAKAKSGKTWITIDANEIAEQLGQPRERLVAALNYLFEQGDLFLQPSGTRLCYSRVSNPGSIPTLIKSIQQRFLLHETREIERLNSVIALAESEDCQTDRLLHYFGESLSAPCGHCGRCLGQEVVQLPKSTPPKLTPGKRDAIYQLVQHQHNSLKSPRQLARFLCGLTSPQTTREKLTKHELFGCCEEIPFAGILKAAEGILSGSNATRS